MPGIPLFPGSLSAYYESKIIVIVFAVKGVEERAGEFGYHIASEITGQCPGQR
jgi:hypothetical protein